MGKWAILILLLLPLAACASDSSRTVTLVADGERRTLTTDALTVRDLLAEAGITLDEDDRVVPVEPTFIEDGMAVHVIRVEVRTETEEQIIPYERQTIQDATVPAGETHLLRAGVNGIQELTYAITLEDGVETDRRLVRRVTVQEPEDEVLLIGAREELSAVPISGTIAYISARNVWVMRTTTGNRRRLTTAGDLDGRVFDLSPDGSQLIFSRAATDTLNTLWLLETGVADAAPVRLDVDGVLWAAWSPDGEQIAYSTGELRGNDAAGWEAANDLYVARPRASDGRLVARRRVLGPSAGGAYGWWGTLYAWSPDGESLAYARADEVGVVRLRAEQATPLLRFAPYRTYGNWAWTPAVAWSPDGEFIVTVAHSPSTTGEMPEDSPVFDLYALRITIEDGEVVSPTLTVELASEVGMWATPSFSPDGNSILFGRARAPYTSQTSTYELALMDRDGSGKRLLFPPYADEPGLDYPAVAWDPWEGQIAVVYRGDLYLVAADGEARRITEDGGVTAVRWAGRTATEEEQE